MKKQSHENSYIARAYANSREDHKHKLKKVNEKMYLCECVMTPEQLEESKQYET